jgi:hypothetical protein
VDGSQEADLAKEEITNRREFKENYKCNGG